jgi:hypothetical protein
MALRFGQSKGEDVNALIAKKSYAKAIELIKQQLKTQRSDPRLRMQLADVLVLAGKAKEAVMILTPIADEFAREGFAAKAIAVLKRIQKIDPSARDVEAKLASLIQEKQQQATVSVPAPSTSSFEIGMEEIGFEPPPHEPVVVPAGDRPSAAVSPAAPELDIAVEPVVEPEPAPPPAQPVLRTDREVVIEEVGIELEPEPESEPAAIVAPEPIPARPPEPESPVIILEPESDVAPALSVEPEPMAPLASAAEPEFVLDDEDEFQLDAESQEAAAAEPVAVEGEPITDNLFVDELMSVLEDAFPSGLEAPLTEPIGQEASRGAQIVVSPLFRHFSVDEMVAVIAGLHLLTRERGQVILREGEAGDSLFMLCSGKVKAFKKNAAGKQVPIAEMEEGAFFGEGSILTRKPRTASIVATTRCELLELDRPTLDSICRTHPHVMDVMREFAAQRTGGK